MAVEKMKKISIITLNEHRETLIKEFQKFGSIHFKELELNDLPPEYLFLSKKAPMEEYKLIEHKALIDKTLKTLRPYIPKRKITSKRPSMTYEECCSFLYDSELSNLYEKVQNISERKDNLLQEQKKLSAEITTLEPYTFLDFRTLDLKDFKKVVAFLISVRSGNDSTLSDLEKEYPNLYFEEVGMLKQDTIYLIVADIEKNDEIQAYLNGNGITILDLQFNKVPTELIQDNQSRLNIIETEISQCNDELKSLAVMYDTVLIELDSLKIVTSQNMVVNNFLNSHYVLYMEGWIPENSVSELYKILDTLLPQKYYLDMEDVVQDDTEVPIKLKNKGMFSSFESITEMFSLPRYNELDPTSILAIFYLIFFGMMVGDVGYGLVLTIGSFVALRIIDFKENAGKSIKMFFYLGISVVICGLLYGSIFGVTFFRPIPVQGGGYKPILDTQTDIVFMLVLSLVVGVIHIFTGLIMKGINSYVQKDYAGIFCDSILWILTLTSGILLLLVGSGTLEFGSSRLFGIFFAVCIVGLAATQGRSSESIGGKIGGGLYGVYGLTSYIGDIVSYTRIVALGLSGAYIAFSFNLMSGLIPGVIGRLLFGTLIAVFGQTLNFGLSLLGAYVHSCRLQYVEFFGKFYNGGGKAYKPFKIENDFISIKKENQED
ncbi:MAG TPA: V-type ATP synthase subunit I [Lachnospiraceae bacterium]|nr:V-type ATP synthase subunit I [Lachnospiraceae bacterium]